MVALNSWRHGSGIDDGLSHVVSITNHVSLVVGVVMAGHLREVIDRRSMLSVFPQVLELIVLACKFVSCNELGRGGRIKVRTEMVFHFNRHFAYFLHLFSHQFHRSDSLNS